MATLTVGPTIVWPKRSAIQLYLEGRWPDAPDGGSFTDVDPTTEQPLAQIASATAAVFDAAVRAVRAQLHGEWGATPGAVGGELVNRVADLAERRTIRKGLRRLTSAHRSARRRWWMSPTRQRSSGTSPAGLTRSAARPTRGFIRDNAEACPTPAT
jgi:hypothetical protein